MFGTFWSNYFQKIKQHFYKAVENARPYCKRPIEEVNGEEETFRSAYTPVRKKVCPSNDAVLLPTTRTLQFSRAMHQRVHQTSLASEEEDPMVSVDDVRELETKKVTGRKGAPTSHSSSSSTIPSTRVQPLNRDAFPGTSNETTQPKLNIYSKHIHDGANDGGKLQIHRNLPVLGKSEAHPRKHLGVTKYRHPMSNTKTLNSSSSRWKSYTIEESFRIEEKKRYQQLLQKCTFSSSFSSSSHSISQLSSDSSNSSSPISSPLYEVKLATKSSSLSVHSETESENAVPVIMLSKPKEFKGLVSRNERESSEDRKRYSHHNTAPRTKIPLSDITIDKTVSNSRLRAAESLTRNWEEQEEENGSLKEITRHNQPQRRKSNTIPVIDLSESDSESVQSVKGSDSDSVEIVDEFPRDRKKSSTLKNLYDREWVKHIYNKYTDIEDESDDELILERRKKTLQRIHDKVQNRFKLLGILCDSKDTIVHVPTEKPPFTPLTAEMQEEIDAALTPYPKSEVLVHKFNIKITRRDVHTLDGLKWLNDEVINFYLNLIMERSKGNRTLPRVYAYSTFFYPKLYKSGHQSVSRWTNKVDIFAYDVLLVPIHLGVHWCMATVDFDKKCISYYDSMLGNNSQCLKLLMGYLEAEHLDKKKVPYRTASWKLEHMKDIPEQMNGSDCGVFSCQFGEYASRQAQMDFDQGDMPYFRRRMVYEIIHAVLLE